MVGVTSFNAILQLDKPYSDQVAAALVVELADYHPAASRGAFGHPEVALTIQAETARQAAMTATAVVQAAGYDTYSLEVLPTEGFDRRLGLGPLPDLVSVTEAARELGITRQAVQQRIDSGALAARRVGNTYAIARSTLSKRRAAAPTARER